MIISRHTNEEKKQCVNDYLNGKDKDYLSGKYAISVRTVDRWIKELNVDEVQLKKVKRASTITIGVQEEVLKVLNKNPVFQGFNEVEWNERKVIKYLNDIYHIKINWRMARALIEDAKKVNTIKYEDKIYNDIDELANLGYSIVLLDYIKIGRINRIEVESLELREYTKTKLDVNLVIAKANNSTYLDIILSEINIVDKTNIEITRVSDKKLVYQKKLQRKVIVEDKYEVLNKIKIAEGKENIIFIMTYDKDITKLKKKGSNIKYFIVNDNIYNDLLQGQYKGKYGKTIIDYMYDENNRNRKYKSIRDISQVVWSKIDNYVLKVTEDKLNILKNIEAKKNKIYNIKNEREKVRNSVKILNSNFLHNI